MSLQYIQPQHVQKKSGILGTLGTLASLAGGLTGQPWLTTLGMGMSGIDNVMNGGGNTSAGGGAQVAKETGETWNKIFKELKEGWKNPASSSGNVAKSSEEQAREE